MADEKIVPENGLEVRYERYKGIIKNFTLMSDIFMRNVFKQRECLEYVLQVIMEKQDLKVIDQIIQKDYKNLQGRSAIMDCVARDSEGKQFDVEIQQDNETKYLIKFLKIYRKYIDICDRNVIIQSNI